MFSTKERADGYDQITFITYADRDYECLWGIITLSTNGQTDRHDQINFITRADRYYEYFILFSTKGQTDGYNQITK